MDSNYRREMIGAQGDIGTVFWAFVSYPIIAIFDSRTGIAAGIPSARVQKPQTSTQVVPIEPVQTGVF